MTPILPPDKLDTVLQAVALYYSKQAGGLGVDANEDILLSITEATNILNKLAADALVAELENIVGWRSDAKEPVLIRPEFRHLPLAENVDMRHQMLVSERLAQLTTVPDLSSEQPCQHLHTYSMDSLPPQVHCVDCGANLSSEHEEGLTLVADSGAGSSKHVHSELYAGKKLADADGWTYYTCTCGHKWRTRTVSEEVKPTPQAAPEGGEE